MYLTEDTTHLDWMNFENLKAGTIVYFYKGGDYGCCSEDTMTYGEEHIAVTLDKKGWGTFFTVPRRIVANEPE